MSVFKPLSPWCFVMAALANECRLKLGLLNGECLYDAVTEFRFKTYTIRPTRWAPPEQTPGLSINHPKEQFLLLEVLAGGFGWGVTVWWSLHSLNKEKLEFTSENVPEWVTCPHGWQSQGRRKRPGKDPCIHLCSGTSVFHPAQLSHRPPPLPR